MTPAEAAMLRERLLRVRAQHGLSQQQIAEAAGVSRNTVSNIERSSNEDIAEHTRHLLEEALNVIEHGTGTPHRGPALLYVAVNGAVCGIDAEQFEPETLSARDRTLCRALLALAIDRLGGAS
jgi:transcriptional regulator with XRE-family HTH domain